MIARKKPEFVNAEVAPSDGTIRNTQQYHKGDIIITDAKGLRYPVRKHIFNESYEIVSTEAQ